VKGKEAGTFFGKMRGASKSPPRVDLNEVLWSWIGGFAGIGAVTYVNYNVLSGMNFLVLVGSFGASAVLIYGAIRSPLAQPRNFVGGHLVSAVVGVTCYQLLGSHLWLAAALAVATAIAAMHLTRTLHPPGGATALIAVIGDKNIHNLGYLYVLTPIAVGVVILLIVALVVNNIPKSRKYPEFWF
jgi:CBS-domain-containing membrane protein